MTVLARHLLSLVQLLFASLPLEIAAPLPPAKIRRGLAMLTTTSDLRVTWEGSETFQLQLGSAGAPYLWAGLAPIIRFRLAERGNKAMLTGNAALPSFPRSILWVVMLTLLLLAFGVLAGQVPTVHPVQALPIIGLALSILEIVHLAVIRVVRMIMERLYQILDL